LEGFFRHVAASALGNETSVMKERRDALGCPRAVMHVYPPYAAANGAVRETVGREGGAGGKEGSDSVRMTMRK